MTVEDGIFQAKDKKIIFIVLLMILPLFAGLIISNELMRGASIEVRQFRRERHVSAITSALQFSLAPGEYLYIAEYYMGRTRHLRVVIRNVESVDSFLSRFRGDIGESMFIENRCNLPFGTRYGTFDAYSLNESDFTRLLSFFSDEQRPINVEINVIGYNPRLAHVYDMLNWYYPIWIYLPFLVPLMIQVALIVRLIIRIAKRIIYLICED